MKSIKVFVSHAFDDAHYDGGMARFREEVERLMVAACSAMSVPGSEVAPNLLFEARAYGRPLMKEIRRQIETCDLLIADISVPADAEVNPNVMYEVGYATALKKRLIVIRRATEKPPPADIRDILAGSYGTLEDIPAAFMDEATVAVTETLIRTTQKDIGIETLEKVWFTRDTQSINIVCAPDPEPSKFSDTHDPNYVDIDRFDDRDAVIELATFLAKRYPGAKVVRYLCGEMPQQALDCNLVVLGGPGCVAGEGNEVGKDLMRSLSSAVVYPEEGDGLVWRDEQMRPTSFDAEGRVVEDWGSILAAPNPYNPANRIVMFHGTNTYGTLAAAIALLDSPQALKNHMRLAGLGIEDRLTGHLNFEVLVRAEVGPNRRIKPAPLEFDSIRPITD
jgi:nucleoside 2-deoxyribosyltransferase